MTDLQTVWLRLSTILSAVVAELKSEFSEEDIELISDFIENREFEVAYRWICSVAKDNGLQVSHNVAKDLDAAANLMKILPDK